MSLDLAIFVISALVAVFGATMMIFQRNPVASVLYLILSLVGQAVLYVQLGAAFVGAVLIIVYSGAILVLFLFVIMMLNLRSSADLGEPSPPVSRFVKYFVSCLIFLELSFIIRESLGAGSTTSAGIVTMADDSFGSVESVATLLFTRYLYPFELTSVLLLSAIVGAVIIARRATEDELPPQPEKAVGPISQKTNEGQE